MKIRTSICLSKEIFLKLSKIATAEERNISNMINVIIKEYIEKKEKENE